MKSRILLAAAVAALISTSASAATPAAPAAVAGPWARVPALPTACYAIQDHWWEKNNAALAAVQEDHSRQNDANTVVEQRLNKVMSEDPMAMAQALQQAMMNDPQSAQQMMQRLTQQGEQGQTEIPAQAQKDAQFQAEAKTVIKQYHAALEQAYGTGDARWNALKKRGGYAPDARGPGESGVADWIWAEWALVIRDWKAGYQANCAQWFSTTGPFHAYLKRYKAYLANERIPTEKRLIDQPRLEQYQIMNVSTTGWRTTTDDNAAEDYMRMAGELFSERKETVECELDCR